jgi:hypothetical protein
VIRPIRYFYTLLLISLCLLAAASLYGQAVSSLSGTVTDPTGSVIPNASIRIENANLGLNRDAKSDTAGRYSFPQLPPGTYKVTASAAGFSDVVVNEVQLLVNSPKTLNLPFEKLGQVTETVAVSAEATQVNTTDASIGNAISTKPILQLPLNARNIVGLLALQPGVVTTSEGATDDRNGAVNGGKSDQANVTLDGVDVNDQMDRQAFTSVLRMTPDAMQEFRVTTLNANADSGRTSGAQVVLVTKRGTNDIHGSAYEYHRNTVTTANGFFNNMAGLERPKLIRNIWGMSVGGPVKKNRLFIFFNYEGRRDAKDGTVVRQIPSMDMRQGILHYQRKDGSVATVTPSDLARLIDPSGVNAAALKIFQSYPTPNDYTVGDNLNLVGYRFKAPMPLSWNTYIARIDYNIDQASKHTVFIRGNLQNDDEVSSMPQFEGMPANSQKLTNNKGFGVGLTDLLAPTVVSTLRYGLTRQGSSTTGRQTFGMVTFRGIDPTLPQSRNFSAIIPVHTLSEDLNWTKGAHSFQFGAVARFISNKRTDFQNSFSGAVANASWLVSSGAGLTDPFSDMASSQITNFRYAVTDVMGLITQGNAQYNYLASGKPIGEGNAVLRDFTSREYEMYAQDTWKISRVLTVTAGVRWSLMPPIRESNGQQMSPNIPIGDWFNQRGALAEQGKSQMQAGRISFIPIDKGGRDLYPYHKKNITPRLALAYAPSGTSGLSKFLFGGPGKTAIRAGFGMYYDLFGSGLMRSQDATAFGLSTALTNPSAVLTTASAPRFTAIDQIPSSIMLPDPGANFPAVYPDAFAITRGLDDTLKPPYTMNMNLSVQREFGDGWVAQAAYIGRLARRSLIRRDAAMPTNLKDPKSNMAYFEAATILARQAVAGVATANVAKVPYWENLFSKAATSSLSATQVVYNRYVANMYDWTYALYQLDTGAGYGACDSRARCSDQGPYTFFSPQFSYLSVFSSIGGGNYHGAQFTLNKRFGTGGSMNLNYTFSKSIDIRSSNERAGYSTGVVWNPWFPGLSRGVSDYDNTHLFNALGTYNLPFGKGQKFLGSAHGVVEALLGGWELSGVWRWSSGFPVSVYETGVWPTNWNNNVWASWTGKPIAVAQTKNAKGLGGPNMFPDPNTAIDAFQYIMPGEIGNRNPLRGDGIFNIDSNLSKRFVMPYLDGKHSLQIRWETFNLTNTAKFDAYTASVDISVGGTFGKYTDLLTQPRVMQFGMRYEF